MAQLNCRKFRKNIIIQKRIQLKDRNGILVDIWYNYRKSKADVWNIHGSELLNNLDMFTNKTYKRMQIRYKQYLDPTFNFDITHDYRIIYRNFIYNITSIDDVKDKHQQMEILLTRIENEDITTVNDTLDYYLENNLLTESQLEKLREEGVIE